VWRDMGVNVLRRPTVQPPVSRQVRAIPTPVSAAEAPRQQEARGQRSILVEDVIVHCYQSPWKLNPAGWTKGGPISSATNWCATSSMERGLP
jgi:hypothetical protein